MISELHLCDEYCSECQATDEDLAFERLHQLRRLVETCTDDGDRFDYLDEIDRVHDQLDRWGFIPF